MKVIPAGKHKILAIGIYHKAAEIKGLESPGMNFLIFSPQTGKSKSTKCQRAWGLLRMQNRREPLSRAHFDFQAPCFKGRRSSTCGTAWEKKIQGPCGQKRNIKYRREATA